MDEIRISHVEKSYTTLPLFRRCLWDFIRDCLL